MNEWNEGPPEKLEVGMWVAVRPSGRPGSNLRVTPDFYLIGTAILENYPAEPSQELVGGDPQAYLGDLEDVIRWRWWSRD